MNHLKFRFLENFTKEEREMLSLKRKSDWASGFDLASSSRQDIVIKPNERVLVPTSIAISLVPGLEAQVRSRSGLSLKNGIVVLNSPGTIDADYRGEIKVITANFSNEPFTVTFGMRIAQMVIAPVTICEAMMVEKLDESKRGAQGFGSTGLHG